ADSLAVQMVEAERLKAQAGEHVRPPAGVAQRIKKQIDVGEVVAAGGKERRAAATVGQVGPGKRAAHLQTPEMIEVVADSQADERRVILINLTWDNVVHH